MKRTLVETNKLLKQTTVDADPNDETEVRIGLRGKDMRRGRGEEIIIGDNWVS